jgi:hypothetical protein
MSHRKRKKLLNRIPHRVRTALHRYRKGNFHTPPDLSCLSALDQQRLIKDAKKARLDRLWGILMRSGGVLAAVHWPEYEELVARIRARDPVCASKSDPLTTIEQDYVAGKAVSLGMNDLCHATPERAALVANRRAKFVRSSLERGERDQLNQTDVCTQLLPLIHPWQLKKVQQTITRLSRIPSFDAEGKTRKDQKLRAKQARCLTSLRHCWQEIFAHPVTLEKFQSRLEKQIWANRRFPSRIA